MSFGMCIWVQCALLDVRAAAARPQLSGATSVAHTPSSLWWGMCNSQPIALRAEHVHMQVHTHVQVPSRRARPSAPECRGSAAVRGHPSVADAPGLVRSGVLYHRCVQWQPLYGESGELGRRELVLSPTIRSSLHNRATRTARSVAWRLGAMFLTPLCPKRSTTPRLHAHAS
jgi:hypothetical protein